ncbi:MAG: SPASM domain-containing protein, partial [Bacilli bacterium]|nr:SPASM domain-containing protein [Bacilli bacterium]
GMEFYRHFIELINLNSSPSVKVSINIQTNGTLMTSAWASFFHDNGFLVGVSVDGNREIHDKYRLARDGSKSYDKVIKAIEILREHKVEFNVLTVVHDELTEHVNEIYEAYRQQLFENLQFIPCLEPLGTEPDQKPWLDPRKYGQFLIELFDLWYADLMQGQYRSIRYFDNVIRMASNEEPPSCEMKGRCSIQFVVEADGSVYPCDYYALDAYLLGNINVDSFAGMYGSKAAKDFLLESYHDHDDCRVCPYYQLCRGGCKRHQQNEAHGPIGLNRFCLAYIMFFDARIKEIEKIAAFYIQSKQDYEK